MPCDDATLSVFGQHRILVVFDWLNLTLHQLVECFYNYFYLIFWNNVFKPILPDQFVF